MSITAVRIKLNSIQEYIFTSNKLSENIGASNITDQLVFRQTMTEVLKILFGEDFAFSITSDQFQPFVDVNSAYKYSVLDIGGGGAIVLFNKQDNSSSQSKDFIRAFSKSLLIEYPGLKYSIAIDPNFDFDDFKKGDQTKVMNQVKNKFHLVSCVPKHGFTQDCPLNNDAAEIYTTDTIRHKTQIGHKHKGVSKSAGVKLMASRTANEHLSEKLSFDFTFSDDLLKLGQQKEGSYIAVVHVDGNGVGAFINSAKTAIEFKDNSLNAQDCASKAIKELLTNDIVLNIENGKFASEIDLAFEEKQCIVPIRPLLGGGDDFTFVCEGRLGMYLAEKFVSYFVGDGSIIKSACAGVAIVKTKFPFYKAYKLAEELCSEAKSKSRDTNDSFISFYCAADSFAGSLEQIRERTQMYKATKLYQGPYNIFNKDAADSLCILKTGIKQFKEASHIPNNKIQKLRELLIADLSAKKAFLKELREMEHELPGAESIEELISEPKKLVRYFDQIELMDFYLINLLKYEN